MANNYSRNLALVWNNCWYQTATAYDLDSVFTYESGGDAVYARFTSPVTQTLGDLTVYAFVPTGGVLGTPTDIRCAIYNGPGAVDDDDRPEFGGSPLATSGAVNCSSAAGSWVAFTLSSVSLTQGECYYLVFDNRSASPAVNYCSIQYKPRWGGAPYSAGYGGYMTGHFSSGYTANGFTSDPTISNTYAPFVVKFDDDSLIGDPYVDSTSVEGSGLDDRGNRYQFDESVIISGFGYTPTSPYYDTVGIYDTAGSLQVSSEYNKYSGNNGGCKCTPTILAKATAYDCVFIVGASLTGGIVYNMGEASPPADVVACRPAGLLGYVKGSTPGSYSFDNTKMLAMSLVFDDFPAIAGGSGGIAKLVGNGGGLIG